MDIIIYRACSWSLYEQIDNLRQRIHEKENKHKKNKAKSGKSGKGFKIFKKSKEQLMTEQSSTQNKLKEEISNRDTLKVPSSHINT